MEPEETWNPLATQTRPLTVAAFMALAHYHPEHGYYARSPQRSGRAGDFFTSVDVGPVFGELLEVQLAEMFAILAQAPAPPDAPASPSPPARPALLVEAAAGNGRLSADILRAARRRDPELFERLRVHLVEASADARAAQASVLGDLGDHLAGSGAALPDAFEGVLLANELLDALPVHQVVMREGGLRELYVVDRPAPAAGPLGTVEGPLSDPAIGEYFARLGIALEPGWRAEVNLRALDWIRDAARRLRRGFIVLIDYGHEARDLYDASHAAGTLTTFSRHTSPGAGPPSWLARPGEQDITAHVDFTSVRAAAVEAGLTPLGFLDQTYFLIGLGAGEFGRGDESVEAVRRRLALKTLIMPGGLGSTHKVLLLGRGVGTPVLRGCSFRVRVT